MSGLTPIVRPGALLGLLCLLGCTPFEAERLDPLPQGGSGAGDVAGGGSGGNGGSSGGGGAGGSEMDAGCERSAETCNGRDDDCDGFLDESTEDFCRTIVVNAETSCVSSTTAGVGCVLISCLEGFTNCNGDPTDGCECAEDDDGGTEDGGEEDGG